MPIFLSITVVNSFIEPLKALELLFLPEKDISFVFQSSEHFFVSNVCLGLSVETASKHAPVVVLLNNLRVIIGVKLLFNGTRKLSLVFWLVYPHDVVSKFVFQPLDFFFDRLGLLIALELLGFLNFIRIILAWSKMNLNVDWASVLLVLFILFARRNFVGIATY